MFSISVGAQIDPTKPASPVKSVIDAAKDLRQDARQKIQETRQNVRQEAKDLKQSVREEAKDLRQNIREEAKEVRQNTLVDIKQNREAAKSAFEAKREEAKNLIEQRREEMKNKLEAKREEAKTRIEAEKEALKGRLAKIKDEKKKQTVEKIANQINELNKKRLNHFSAVLGKLEGTLEKISGRTDKAEANGLNVGAIKTMINEATNAISESRTAIQNQAGKTYSISIGNENALKADVGKARQALHADLAIVEKSVKNSREAIKKVIVALAQIPKINELEVNAQAPATSETQSPSSQEETATQPVQ